MTAAEQEVRWFAHVLLPELRASDSAERAQGAWHLGAARVVGVEDRLTTLESSGRDDVDRSRARALRDAVRDARGRIGALVATGAADVYDDLGAVAADLDAVLDAGDPWSDAGPGSPSDPGYDSGSP